MNTCVDEKITRTQQNVIDEAKKRMQDKPWFKSVCIDNLPCDSKLSSKEEFEDAVCKLVDDTTYFDGE